MLRVAVESATAASRRRGNGTLPCDEHPFQARGFFEAASARLRRALRRSHNRVSAQGGGLISRATRPRSLEIYTKFQRQSVSTIPKIEVDGTIVRNNVLLVDSRACYELGWGTA